MTPALPQRLSHTPGPWRWQKGERFHRLYGHREGAPAAPILVADMVRGQKVVPIAPANARLIAAAPELLAALEACCDRFEESLGGEDMTTPEAEIFAAARAALVKARGDA